MHGELDGHAALRADKGKLRVSAEYACLTRAAKGKDEDRFLAVTHGHAALVCGICDGHSIHSNSSGQRHAEAAAAYLASDVWKRVQSKLTHPSASARSPSAPAASTAPPADSPQPEAVSTPPQSRVPAEVPTRHHQLEVPPTSCRRDPAPLTTPTRRAACHWRRRSRSPMRSPARLSSTNGAARASTVQRWPSDCSRRRRSSRRRSARRSLSSCRRSGRTCRRRHDPHNHANRRRDLTRTRTRTLTLALALTLNHTTMPTTPPPPR